jgi:hypothetical protein
VDIPDVLIPHWPSGFDAWEGFATLVIIGLFKVDRGLMMMRRARVIDRLGWSIIIFDLTMGGLFLISMFWSLYPSTAFRPWFPRLTVLALLITTVWQWFEIRRASAVRVDLVAAGANGGSVYHPDVDTYSGIERRVGPDDRRGYVAAEDY